MRNHITANSSMMTRDDPLFLYFKADELYSAWSREGNFGTVLITESDFSWELLQCPFIAR